MVNDFADQLLAEIEAFLAVTGMPETTLGRRAVRDGSFVTRLRETGNCTFKTAAAVRAFMRSARALAASDPEAAA
jgi:hypothetical protein